MDTIRWGIAATGGIARDFVDDLARLDDLAADPDVDVVYVASPHSAHAQDTIRFLDAGKHVLCEKPFALDAVQTRAMVDAARRNGRFLMEAMWSRFLPAYVTLRRLLDDGAIGTPRFVDASFGFVHPYDAAHRLFDPALGGGSLLDLGVYPVQRCLRAREPESPVMPPAESVRIMETVDAIRGQVGVVYDGDLT